MARDESLPAGVLELEKRILHVYDDLTPKQHRVARFMMDNAMVVALAPAGEVASQAHVDAATVVRFCQLLGYTGYAELKREITQSIPHFATARAKLESRAGPGTTRGESVVADVLRQDATNLARTLELNSRENFDAAVELLTKARRVYCVGFGRSGVVTALLSEHLAYVGVTAQNAHRDVGQAAALLAQCSEGDAVVIVSLWRYHRSAVKIFRKALAAGVPTLVMTDNPVSPFATDASVVLVAATDTPGLTHSLTAIVALCDALVTGVAFRDARRAVEGFKRVDEIYADLDVYEQS